MTPNATNRPWIQRGAGRPRAVCLWLLVGFMALSVPGPVHGQTADWDDGHDRCAAFCRPYTGFQLSGMDSAFQLSPKSDVLVLNESTQHLDRSLLSWLNARNNRVFTATMQAADASFYPLVFGSVPAYWAVTVVSDDVATSSALAYSLGWVATAGSTLIMKRMAGRERPYVSNHDLIIRYTQAELDELDASSSMPSGHASMSVFAASYVAMEVNTPVSYAVGGLWATSVAVSRLWNGVHFPSDIAAGTILGIGTALIVRRFE